MRENTNAMTPPSEHFFKKDHLRNMSNITWNKYEIIGAQTGGIPTDPVRIINRLYI